MLKFIKMTTFANEPSLTLMMQIYNMNADDVRCLAREYIKQGVISRAIQCFERLLWLGELRQREYLKLVVLYKCTNISIKSKRVIYKYKNIYKQ